MSAPLFRLRGIAFAHPGARRILADVDFDLDAGERVALIGANGAGKTTLLRIMVGLLAPAAGTITAFGSRRAGEAAFHEVRCRAGLLFQDADDQLFCPTVLEDVAFGPLNLGKTGEQAREIAERTLAGLGLAGFGGRITYKLSGGEKRLVSLATVLAMEPDVLLLDEPTNALDEAAADRLLDYLGRLPQAMAIATHDRRVIAALATRAVLLRDGSLLPTTVHDHPHTHLHRHPHVHAATADAIEGSVDDPDEDDVVHGHRHRPPANRKAGI
ncbi:MAG: energy-coupling factor ABC transporter ATP-binding protein [Rhodospirillales bacterium]